VGVDREVWQLLLRPGGLVSAIIRRATGPRYNAEAEATVTFADGSTAYLCVYESVARLLLEGHTITVVDCDGYDDSVEVQPPVHENLTAILGRNARSVQAILACDRAIH